MERWESNLINRGHPNNRGSRASLLPLPCKPMAAPLSPTPFHLGSTSGLLLSAAQAGICQGRLDPIPAGHDVLAVQPGVGDFVTLDLNFLISKMGTALVPASPSSVSE